MLQNDKPTIVILHGWGLSKLRFAPLIQEFESRKYIVVAPDFPGFGESTQPTRPLTLNDYVDFLWEFLQTNNVKHPVFIGHSFGGRVSLRYNTMHPKSVRTLILTGTPGFTPIPRKKLLLFISMAKIGKILFSIPGLSFFMTSVRRWYYYVVGAKEFNKAQGYMKDTFKHIVSEPLINDMTNIDIPCYLLWGQNDTIVPISIAKRMAQCIKGAQLRIIPDMDHGIPYKHPKIFADEVEKMLMQ